MKVSNNRRRGLDWEREIVRDLRECGFPNVVTTRSYSRQMDDGKVDITDPENEMPFHIQAKATQTTPSFGNILKDVKFKDKPLLLIHKKHSCKTVTMEYSVFLQYMSMYAEQINK